MLKYFVQTTEVLMTAALLVGIMVSFAKGRFGLWGRIVMWAGLAVGTVGSAVMAYMKNATRKIDTSLWNYRMFMAAIGALVIFWVLYGVRKLLAGKKKERVLDVLCSLCLGLMSCVLIVYSATDVWAYPYNILMVEKSLVSTTFILKCVGILLGIVLALVAGLAAGQGFWRLGRGPGFWIMSAMLTVNVLRQASVIVSVMLTKRMILPTASYYHTCFEIVKFTSNNSRIFLFAQLILICFVPVILWAMSFMQKEPYENPAQHRKIKRKWRTARRWATTVLCAAVLTLWTVTGLKAITERVVELSPIEDSVIKDGAVWVSFEQVSDGHLHRFGYVTDNGVQVRFIVIKKPNSSSFGVGMDACDICGETGYYERDGQVVCNLCDVVMNINTIGFKGGCNPKIVDYSIKDGNIVVPCEALAEYEKDFK